MCGIAGVLSFRGPLQDRELPGRMAALLAHRGPDEESSRIEGPIGLGFRRLRIIDLEGGRQPVANEAETIWTVLNGEIYNFVELRAQLEGKGHRFRTNSDTEVLVHAYEQYGLEFVHCLRGMFAIAVWDSPAQRLVLVRDRIGKKPLFWSVRNGELAFASELKALLAWPGLDRTLDPEAVHDYLGFLSVPSPRTIFKHVHKLEPAHWLVARADTGDIRTGRYWQLRPAPERSRPRSYFVQRLRELMEESVRLRLRSDVPLGALLSGGIDSSAIVGLMVREPAAGTVRTFSVGFEDTSFDETTYARLAAREFGTHHTEEIVGPMSPELLQRVVWHLDEPFADSSAIPTFQVARTARNHVTVALSGDGGDELFAGYPRYQYARWIHWASRIPTPLRTAALSGIRTAQRRLTRRGSAMSEGLRRVAKGIDLLSRSMPEQLMALLNYYEEAEKRTIYHSDFAAQLNGYSSLDRLVAHTRKFSDVNDPMVAFMAHDCETNLVDDSLVKVDRMSMACGLEVRSPFLDHKLVEFALTIPPEFKVRHRQTKRILKESLHDVLPKAISSRGKQGFAVPFGPWFLSGPWRNMLEDCLSEHCVRRRGVFDPEAVKNVKQLLLGDDTQCASRLSTHQVWHRSWILVMFELWARQYLDRHV